MGNHADIHTFINMINPLFIEYFDNALEGLNAKESAFIRLQDFEFCLTRII